MYVPIVCGLYCGPPRCKIFTVACSRGSQVQTQHQNGLMSFGNVQYVHLLSSLENLLYR